MLIPQALAYAQLAGMPPITGLYAALLPGIVGALFGSSSLLAVGPVALTSLLTFAALQPMAEAGSPEWVAMAIWLALYSGLMQFLMGAFRMGILANLVSNAVVQGFVNAAAVIIIVSQLPFLLGFGTGTERNWLSTIWHEWQHTPLRLMVTAGFGLGGVVVLLLLGKFTARLPAVMVVTLIGIAYSYLLGFGELGGSVIGPVGSGLPKPSLIASLVVPISLFGFTQVLYYLPTAILAAITIMPVTRLIDIRSLTRLSRENPKDGVVALVTLVVTLLTAWTHP